MAEEVTPVEVRRVRIEYEIAVPTTGFVLEAERRPVVDRDLVEAVRRELIRTGSRNPDIFGGRA
jgi:hypothetical protein